MPYQSTTPYSNDLFIRAARGETTPRTPIWLMRQAGRTDPEYNRVKRESGMPLEKLFRHPELAAQISLLPKRFGVDAIIFFQDILTPLSPMGTDFVFAPGPVIENPVRAAADVRALKSFDVASELAFVGETFRIIQQTMGRELPVLGFAGAPLTLAVFMVEGKSFGSSADASMRLLAEQPALAHQLLEKLTAMTIDYLKYQIEAGAAAVQMFESAAMLLSKAQYLEFALPYQQRIFEALKGLIPTIMFAREWIDLNDLASAGADIVSLPSGVTIASARESLGSSAVLQGNLDNHLLAHGSMNEIEAAARECVASGRHTGHIFNLNHGLLRDTPFENVLRLIEIVHES